MSNAFDRELIGRLTAERELLLATLMAVARLPYRNRSDARQMHYKASLVLRVFDEKSRVV